MALLDQTKWKNNDQIINNTDESNIYQKEKGEKKEELGLSMCEWQTSLSFCRKAQLCHFGTRKHGEQNVF